MLTNKETPAKIEKDAFRIVAELAHDPKNHEAIVKFEEAYRHLIKAADALTDACARSNVELPSGSYRDPSYYQAIAGAAEDLRIVERPRYISTVGDRIVTVTAQTGWPIPKRWWKQLGVKG